ncbi:endonuclease domain-containing protein [Sandaracinobacter neustonicus]|uniref:endonuclease domain-containing protein n=1 Tax=Sandaracinobacter neustonicus TaxID=1715348 RepID=UPI002E27593A
MEGERPIRRPATVAKARKLRRTMTYPEVLLWQQLRGQPDGVKFRRQHPLGAYVADFFCVPARLAIEVDGAAHDRGDAPSHDAARDQWFSAQGVTVLRIPASTVLADARAVAADILATARASFPLHHPSDGPPPPQAGEEQE